jgi:hypothetical protein
MATTLSQFRSKIEVDLDLQEETFITSSEITGYVNEALREAQREVLGIYEDYFLTKTNLALSIGVSTYSMPSDIYANKIRGMIYDNNYNIYEIRRIRTPQKFLDRHLLRNDDPTDYYMYIIINDAVNGFQIELSPAAKETSATAITLWYLRDISVIASDSDVIDQDIPECIDFMFAYVKGQCLKKENSGLMPPEARDEIERQRKLLVDVLTNMVPDDDNTIIKDTTYYRETS